MDHEEVHAGARTGAGGGEEDEITENMESGTYDGTQQQANYDPNEQLQYYYDPVDGNYYYYAPQYANEADPTGDVNENVGRSDKRVTAQELENWEPVRYNWFSDTVLSIFMSLGYKLYLCMLLYCAIILQLMLSLNWTLQVLYRFYAPQSEGDPSTWSPVCFFTVFILLSFFVVTALCTSCDMLHGAWRAKREDIYFWGATTWAGKSPPVWLHFFVILLTTGFPFLWATVEAAVAKGSFTYFLCIYAFIAVVTVEFMIVGCYVWFYFLGIRGKITAMRLYRGRDDFETWERASKYSYNKQLKKRWYHASTLLEEYGLDEKTLRSNALSFTIGYVPLFAVYTAQAFSTNVDYPEMTWAAICTVALCCVYFLAWFTVFRKRSHWSVYFAIFLIVTLVLTGIIAAITCNLPGALGLIIVLFVLSQCMLARKREHTLTRVEQRTLFGMTDTTEQEDPIPNRRVDMHLCCCGDVLANCFRCLGAREAIGYRHPDVVRVEEQYNRENVSLRTDQRLLMWWWIFVMAVVASIIGIGNHMAYDYRTEIAVANGVPIEGNNTGLFLCQIRYNKNGSAPLGLYDLSLLSALAYTVGEPGERDFATWFSFFPNFVRMYPRQLPPNSTYATDGIEIPFSHYVDMTSDYHVFTLNSNSRGLSFMRDVDEWGISITLQLAKVFSPFVGMWPEGFQRSFVQRAAFLQSWFPGVDVLGSISKSISQLIDDGKKERILLVGDGFNGGYVKLLSTIHGVPFVALNAPGIGQKAALGTEGTQVLSPRSLLSYVDSIEDTTHTIYIPCDSRLSLVRCSKIEATVNTLRGLCGDVHGRMLH
ncbi:hypothetical protein, conserved [Trypanosoma brucei gambiense DAL972]|uniref:Transmembrane protein n=2 Tax=Trypanosoma brucei TaxID=5691 RepID=C9ZRI1_TRYB9|nr:hypothetical protein, conserved [Trypanosoma brucei gambiense DAL972]RHW72033.1 hypothetical protein DPX39_060054600 [Trypanosoma brucei equiperdum]CBH12011.1 hypothetical protein, conserved [Trypanosoma brucei gambiense DAL972]|eukprot:XP_011774296.1 hypothetical protein, conserved [Trypanosoma brucei gambiense DAL972]